MSTERMHRFSAAKQASDTTGTLALARLYHVQLPDCVNYQRICTPLLKAILLFGDIADQFESCLVNSSEKYQHVHMVYQIHDVCLRIRFAKHA